MSECLEISIRDQLPELVHGVLDDLTRARVQAHVDGCAECAEEVALMRKVIASAATATVSHADVARIALAIPPYRTVSEQQAPRRGVVGRRLWFESTYMRLAAGFVIAAVGISTIAVTHTTPSNPLTVPAKVGAPAATQPGVALVGVSGLSDEHLQQLIESMDDLDAAPASEPDSYVTPVFGGSV